MHENVIFSPISGGGRTPATPYAGSATVISKLQKCVSGLDRWCISNKMVLGIDKFRTLFISKSQKKSKQQANYHLANVKISNTTIDEVRSTKLLCVNVDETLSWCMQVGLVKNVFLLKKIRKLETVITFYE